ncbi:MAG: hypothetical protein ACXWR1_09840 [Bdellovibrionota bacterium]
MTAKSRKRRRKLFLLLKAFASRHWIATLTAVFALFSTYIGFVATVNSDQPAITVEPKDRLVGVTGAPMREVELLIKNRGKALAEDVRLKYALVFDMPDTATEGFGPKSGCLQLVNPMPEGNEKDIVISPSFTAKESPSRNASGTLLLRVKFTNPKVPWVISAFWNLFQIIPDVRLTVFDFAYRFTQSEGRFQFVEPIDDSLVQIVRRDFKAFSENPDRKWNDWTKDCNK